MSKYKTRTRTAIAGVIGIIVLGIAGFAILRRAPVGAVDPPPRRAAPAAVVAPKAAIPASGAAITAEAEPAGALRLEGQVIDDHDAPVAGATIVVDSTPPRRATSDASGSFAIDGLLPRAYTVEAHAGDRVGGPLNVRLSDKTDPVTLRLTAGGRAEVKIIDERTGHPVEAAAVELGGRFVITQASDARGVAHFTGVITGRHAIRVTAPGYAPAASELAASAVTSATASATVALRHGAAVTGSVLGVDGAPVAGAVVELDDATQLAIAARPEPATTDASGHWRFPAVARGTYRFTATASAGSAGPLPPITLDGVTAYGEVVLRLVAGGRLSGQVVAPGGAPAAWAVVRVALPGSLLKPRIREVTADAAGKFALAHLPIGHLEVSARGDAGSASAVAVELTAAGKELTLVLADHDAIAGVVVTADGQPIADAQVTAVATAVFGALATTEVTDQAGHFELRGLASGTYRVSAARQAQAWRGLSRDWLDVPSGTRDLRVVVREAGRLHGRVAFATGGAPSRFTIALGLSAPLTVASADGAFAFDDIPAGTLRLVASGADFVARTLANVVIQPGQDTDVGTITVERGRSLTGHVRDARGTPVARASVIAGHKLIGSGNAIDGAPAELSAQLQSQRTTTDDQGAFVLTGIGPGAMLLAAEQPSVGRSAVVTVADGTDDPTVDLVLQPGITLSGRVTRGGQPLAQVVITATPSSAPDAVLTVAAGGDGTYQLDGLTPDRYTVAASLVGGASVRSKTATVVITAGQPARLDFDLADDGVEVDVAAVGAAPATFAQILMSSAPLTSGTAAALKRQLAAAGAPSLHTGFIQSGQPAQITSVAPGDYSICAIKLPGDPHDPKIAAELIGTAGALVATCQPFTVAAAPAQQRATVELH
jgi:hypothetical protein